MLARSSTCCSASQHIEGLSMLGPIESQRLCIHLCQSAGRRQAALEACRVADQRNRAEVKVHELPHCWLHGFSTEPRGACAVPAARMRSRHRSGPARNQCVGAQQTDLLLCGFFRQHRWTPGRHRKREQSMPRQWTNCDGYNCCRCSCFFPFFPFFGLARFFCCSAQICKAPRQACESVSHIG